MTCKHCGAEIAEGSKFCENCGNKIEAVVTETVEEVVEDTVKETEGYKEPERVEAEVVEEGAKTDFSSDDIAAENETASAAEGLSIEAGPIGYSIASLVCGILGLLCCCCGFFGLILSAAGVILGIISLNKNCEGKGMAIAGIVCGGIGAAFTLITIILGTVSGNFGLDNLENFDNFDQITDLFDSL